MCIADGILPDGLALFGRYDCEGKEGNNICEDCTAVRVKEYKIIKTSVEAMVSGVNMVKDTGIRTENPIQPGEGHSCLNIRACGLQDFDVRIRGTQRSDGWVNISRPRATDQPENIKDTYNAIG